MCMLLGGGAAGDGGLEPVLCRWITPCRCGGGVRCGLGVLDKRENKELVVVSQNNLEKL